MQLSPTQSDIDYWVSTLLLPKDIYFLDGTYCPAADSRWELLPVEELHEHPEYGAMHYLNAYEYWAMDRERVRQVLAGDLLLYEDAEGRLRHAAYAVDGDLVLNKNGEVKFHPVKLLKVEKLAREWPGNTLKLLRRQG
jgi:hypothetical protein